jgi:hypothetical protein
VARRLVKGRVDDRVFYDHLRHAVPPLTKPRIKTRRRLTESAI